MGQGRDSLSLGDGAIFPILCMGELSCLDEGTLPWRRSALSECSC